MITPHRSAPRSSGTRVQPRLARPLVLLVVLAMGLGLSGCGGPTFESLPLPGTKVSGEVIDVTADFDEALNLTDGAQIRVNGVDSGRVQDVTVHDFRARVEMRVKKSARLRQGATARLRYTTPLGELFIDVKNPSRGALLRDGATMNRDQTATAPTVEDALSSASLLINGGGLGQLKVITDESNKILGGREGTIRDLLGRSQRVVGSLNESHTAIDRSLTALNKLSTQLHQRRGVIKAALRDIEPASKALRSNLDELTALLDQLTAFAGTANSVVGATRTQVLSLIREVGPILQEMASTRTVLPATLKAVIRLADTLQQVVPGDYLNLGTRLKADSLVLGTDNPVGNPLDDVPGLPQLPNLPGLPDLSSLGLGGLLGTLTGQGAPGGTSPKSGASDSDPVSGLLGGLLGGGR